MPTYEYSCKQCGYTFEAMQNMHEPPVAVCPQCGATPHRIVSGGIGIIYKGSGFYATDTKSAPASVPDAAPVKTESASSG
ncbi:hypothetical protein FACS1894172_06240 [Spirochaetia bacterium]|nr:hypothetical protein FACS1894164_20440 [Spirochaetia bacterium]GHU31396.1 hypothetical protein FACS1894172_06240 [Spirochaetia bacterium]